MTKDDALRIALNALLGCTYDERMRAIGAVKDALSGGETAAEAPAPAGPARVRNPRMWIEHHFDDAAKERQPLTDECINGIANSMPGGLAGFMKGWGWQQFARAIEAAHGIGGQQ